MELVGNECSDTHPSLESTVVLFGLGDTYAKAIPLGKNTKVDGEFARHRTLAELEVDDPARTVIFRKMPECPAAIEPKTMRRECRDGSLAKSFVKGRSSRGHGVGSNAQVSRIGARSGQHGKLYLPC